MQKIVNSLPFIAITIVGWHTFQNWQKPSDRTIAEPTSDQAITPRTSIKIAPVLQGNQTSNDVWDVIKIYDGDTITVVRNGEQKKIRFACIDAPELKQPMGQASRDNLRNLIAKNGDHVTLNIVDTDRYGRSVAEVWAGDTLTQADQIQNGVAYVYERYLNKCPSAEPLKIAQVQAQQKGLGVWSGDHQKPWDYRKSSKK